MESADAAAQMNSSMSDADKRFFESAQFATGLICYPTLCCFGMFGNLISLTILCHKSMRNSTNVYLSGLCISDFIKLVTDSLYFFTILLSKVSPKHGNMAYGYLYPYAHYIFNMSVCVSAWLVVAVAADRYILVCHAIRSKGYCTVSRARIVTSAVFVSMILITIPFGLKYKTVVSTGGIENSTTLDVNVTSLWKKQSFSVAYNWIQNLFRSIIPLIILVILNGFIIRSARATRANRRMTSRNRITVMLITVVLVFCVCVTPDAIMSTIVGVGYHESKSYTTKGVREITDMLLTFNAAINIVLYTLFNPKFRAHFISCVCPCRKRKLLAQDRTAAAASENRQQSCLLPHGEAGSNSLPNGSPIE